MPEGRGQEELPCIRGQGWWPGGATPSLRPGAVTLKSYPSPYARGQGWRPGGATQHPRPGAWPGGPTPVQGVVAAWAQRA